MSTHSRRAECGAVPKIVFARLVVALAVANVVAEHLGSATGVKARLCMEFGINWWKRGPADTGIIDIGMIECVSGCEELHRYYSRVLMYII